MLLASPFLLAQADSFLRYSQPHPDAELLLMDQDAFGNIYVAGRSNDPNWAARLTPNGLQPRLSTSAMSNCFGARCNDIVVARIRSFDGQMEAATFLGGIGDETPTALYVAPSGAIFLAGTTTSRNLPTNEGAFKRSTTSPSTAFIAVLHPSLAGAFYVTYIGGRSNDRISAIEVDRDGSVFATGVTDSADFPTSEGAYRRTHLPGMVFALKLSAGGNALQYSTFLRQGTSSAIRVEPNGSVIVAGNTNGNPSDGFLVRLTPNLSTVVNERLLGGSRNDSITDMTVDANGNMTVAGTSFSKDFPLTSPDATISEVSGTAYVARLNWERIEWARALRGNDSSSVSGIVTAADGSVHVWGFTNSVHFPTTANAFKRCAPEAQIPTATAYYARLQPTGALAFSTLFHDPVYDSKQWLMPRTAEDVFFLGYAVAGIGASPNVLKRLDLRTKTTARFDCVVNTGTYRAGTVAPGLVVALFGTNIGPAQAASGTIEAGKVTTAIGGTQVFFDGTPAPLLFANGDQINAIVPAGVAGRAFTQIRIEPAGVTATVPVQPMQPGLFRLGATEYGVILNEDGTVNTPDNPAARGAVITFWITGFGAYETTPADGEIFGGTLSRTAQPVTITIQNQMAELLYAGSAPGMVAGVAQVNARVPQNLPVSSRLPIHLRVGSANVQGAAYIAVK